eukprot:1658954-Pyramimonas_sp.AAC.2
MLDRITTTTISNRAGHKRLIGGTVGAELPRLRHSGKIGPRGAPHGANMLALVIKNGSTPTSPVEFQNITLGLGPIEKHAP